MLFFATAFNEKAAFPTSVVGCFVGALVCVCMCALGFRAWELEAAPATKCSSGIKFADVAGVSD